MPFKNILAEIVSSDMDGCSAIVADWEGEAVDWLSSVLSDEDLKLFAAHIGIVARQLQQIGENGHVGNLHEIVIRSAGADWFVFPITSEYYLAVASSHAGNRAKICHIAHSCVESLRVEID
jgi:hypothetical protein